MSGVHGAEFAEIAPKNSTGLIRVNPFLTVPASAFDIDNGVIFPLTPVTGTSPNIGVDRCNSFRMGQQIIFWFGIANPIVTISPDNPSSANWLTRLRLKLWWLRPDVEFRAPGSFPGPRDLPANSGWTPTDQATFGRGPVGGGNGSFMNNRYCWIPSPKRLDTTPFMVPPPPVSPAGNSDSILLDDILTWDLQDPNTAALAASFSSDQIISRWTVLMYPAMGYALGVTAEPTYNSPPGGGIADPPVRVSCTYAVGTLGGTNYQESLG